MSYARRHSTNVCPGNRVRYSIRPAVRARRLSWLRAAVVSVLFRGSPVRATKVAIAEALRIDPAVSELVPAAQIFAVERATLPILPSIELVGMSSERVDTGPMVKHELSVQCTVSHPTEDAGDELLDSIVAAVRRRLLDAEHSTGPIALVTGEGLLVVVHGTLWSISAADASSVIRGASVSVSVEVSE